MNENQNQPVTPPPESSQMSHSSPPAAATPAVPRTRRGGHRRDILCLIGVALLICYQNCSDAKFSTTTDAGNEIFNPADQAAFACTSFTAIAPDTTGRLDIPARDSLGTCYTIKVLDAVQFSPSSSNPNQDQEVVSRNHDSTASDPLQTRHPYILGEKTIEIYMEGARSIQLSGAADAATSIKVDNFILIGVGPSALIADPSYYQAYGTSDSTIQLNGTTDSVQFRTHAIPLTPFASGGVSTITPLPLDTEIEVQKDYTMDLRALDCGSVGALSDVYLVFQ